MENVPIEMTGRDGRKRIPADRMIEYGILSHIFTLKRHLNENKMESEIRITSIK
jgi:hypothetical protein